MFVDVAFPQRRYQIFTYRIPSRLINQLQIGSRVLVPLGRSSAQGLVFRLFRDFSAQSTSQRISQNRLREVTAIVDSPSDSSLNPILIRLANQVEEHYLSPPGSALRLIVPPMASNRVAKRLVLTESGKQAVENVRLSQDQATVLARLAKTPKGLTTATLQKTIKGNKSAIAGLKRRGLIQEIEWVRTASVNTKENPVDSPEEIGLLQTKDTSFAQNTNSKDLQPTISTSSIRDSSWWKDVFNALREQQYKEFLLHASRLTREAYLLTTIEEILRRKRTALILAPEIYRASRIEALLQDTYKDKRIILIHGNLSARLRSEYWQDIQEGRCDVVIGTRSALFVPLPSVGMIWVDQEEDSSFQEEQSPHYHACTVANMRAKLESALVVLGSSHPSLDTIYTHGDTSENLPSSNQRSRKPLTIEVVPLQQVPYGNILSERMIRGMTKVLQTEGRVLLFLNRKGYSRSLTCKDCGHVPECTTCGVTLVLYQNPTRMMCTYCGQTHIPPTICPSCQSARLEKLGYGTQRAEELVRKQFPQVGVARFDRESIKNRSQESQILEQFRQRTIQILIGTELLFHNHALPPIHFVGIPHADAGLHMPDFRSAERTFHRLMQAVHLLDSTSENSEVVLQTMLPTHHVLEAVGKQDLTIFYSNELEVRKALHYPPYSSLIHIAITGKYPEQVSTLAMECRNRLSGQTLSKQDTTPSSKLASQESEYILGPLLSTQGKRGILTRYVLIIKGTNGDYWRNKVKVLQEELTPKLKQDHLRMEIKVNPSDMQ